MSDDPRSKISGGYWHNLAQQQPASEVADIEFRDRLLVRLQELTGVALAT